MDFRRLFNLRRLSRGPGPGGGGASAPAERQGAFVTPQSLTTFAGASGVVGLLWRTLSAIAPGWGGSVVAAFACALLVGAVLFAISETDPQRGPLAVRDYLVDGFVALVNVLVLFSAAVGATQIVAGASSGSDRPAAVGRTGG